MGKEEILRSREIYFPLHILVGNKFPDYFYTSSSLNNCKFSMILMSLAAYCGSVA
jgi:hypothetical protein